MHLVFCKGTEMQERKKNALSIAEDDKCRGWGWVSEYLCQLCECLDDDDDDDENDNCDDYDNGDDNGMEWWW